MEKSWENFWTTGKVEDYLAYRNVEKEEKLNGSVSSGNGHGAFHHADFGLRQEHNDSDQRKR